MKKKTKLTILLPIAVISIVAAIAAFDYYRTFYANNLTEKAAEECFVKVYKNYSFDTLCQAMEESGALLDATTFKRAARHMKLNEGFKAGFYKFDKQMNNKALVRMIASGWQKPVHISFSGYIRSLGRFAKILSEQFEADSACFAAVLTDKSVMEKYGFEEESFIGMFIPNTYEFYWTETPEKVIDRFSREYTAFWNPERQAQAKDAGLSQKQVSTLASIVIEETKYEPEMPVIAGVYLNRIRKGIPLQADPTVKFALNTKGITRILNKHLKIDSPYNTYRIKGLPPGPITMPPICAIDAVLNYSHHKYLYFCARETFDGQHNFAETMSQHRANARAYHKALNVREKERARTKS